VVADLGLRQAGSTAVDVAAVRAVLDAAKRDPRAASTVGVLADAVSGVLLAAVAYTDPELIVIGGSWARRKKVLAMKVELGLPVGAVALPLRR
jgi:predicted NBD/HSP70 family sugar kinase